MENPPASSGAMESPAAAAGPTVLQGREPSYRAILRVVGTVVASAFALYLVYTLRTPIGWLCFATFLAVCVSAPVNILSRRMPRGGAIALVYLMLILAPVLVGAILVPPAVEAGSDLVSDFPGYVEDLKQTVNENDTLRGLNEDFDLVGKLEDLANDAAGSAGDVAGTLAGVGAGLVGSLFAVFTILVMSMFMVSRGRSWLDAFLSTRPPQEAEALRRALDRMAVAVSSYVAGALAQATIAGTAAFIVLSLLGVPAPLALAVIVALLDLIPLIGATIGAIIVAVVTLFADFPTATIIWVIFAIVYQQFENYVVQPRIQGRMVALDPFIIVVAAIFGGTLLGIVGALVAIPSAAALQIAVREYLVFRRSYSDVVLPPGVEGGGPGVEGGEPPARPASGIEPQTG